MSMTFNMVGGGGLSNTSALLAVTVPNGSSVTITKGTVTLYPVIWDKNSASTKDIAIFVISSSLLDSIAWTIRATLSTSTATSTIVIDAAEEYEIELSYHVPPEYQEVEYLQSSKTQYIATGITPDGNTAIEIKLMGLSTSENRVYGTENSSSASWNRKRTLYYTGSNFKVGYNAGDNTVGGYVANTPIVLKSDKNTVFVDGVQRQSGGAASFTSPQAMSLFALYTAGYGNTYGIARVYYFKVWNGSGVLIADYYPCYRKSDNVAGMWDRVSKTFKSNSGSGSFIVGGDI